MSAYSSHLSHQSMVYDAVRNGVYGQAIRQHVNHNSVVLDLGSGLGLLGLIAARAGARHVYMVEPSPVTQWARQVARVNQLEDRVSFIQGRIEDITLPEKVDVLISVMTGNFLLQEDLLPALYLARDRYLKPGGVMIPDQAEMRVAPASFPALYEQAVAQWSQTPEGLDFSPLRKVAANTPLHRKLDEQAFSFLASPQTLAQFNFGNQSSAEVNAKAKFQVQGAAVMHGYIGWFRMRLGGQWLSTSPMQAATHWSQTILPLDPPLKTAPDCTLELGLHRPLHGEWTWQTSCGEERRSNSTFYARAIAPGRLKLADPQYRPRLAHESRLVLDVLRWVEAGCSMEEILGKARERHPATGNIKEVVERTLVAHCHLDLPADPADWKM